MRGYASRLGIVFIVGALGCQRPKPASEHEVTWERGGLVRLTDGQTVTHIDVTPEINGCLGEVFDPVTGEQLGRGETGKILDVTQVEGARFILASAVAVPNCNVQGQCGAGGPNVTLIWLHVARDMSVVAKRAFTVVDCVESRSVENFDDDWPNRLKLTDGNLTIRFTELVSLPEVGTLAKVSGSVIYDRKNAAAGMRISRAPAL